MEGAGMGKQRLRRPRSRQTPASRSQRKFWTIAGLAAVVLGAGFVYFAFWHKYAAPDFTVQLLNGDRITLSSLRGTAVLVNFWHST
jgi:hypothetical protein